MSYQNYHLLYVASPPQSAVFYSRLLGLQPVEQSAGFALFMLPSGLKLGMWLQTAVEPSVDIRPGLAGTELCFAVDNNAAVDAWQSLAMAVGADILQAPTQLDFGYALTLADPDGHRLRVFCPSQD